MDLNALKCIQIHIPQKGPTNANKMVKNGKNGRKLQIIAKFQKLLNRVTKLQNSKKMSNNVKNAKKCA